MKNRKLTVRIVTLFPKFIENFVENFGIVRKAVRNKLLEIKPVYLRDFGIDRRGTVDGRPYGGGVGMILRADVLLKAISSARKSQISNSQFHRKSKFKIPSFKTRTILLTPQGKKFTQKDARRLSKYDNLILVCGRYEGFDERVRHFADEEISIGDYVLMGGELPALVMTEAVARLREGILGKAESSVGESFNDGLLEHPQYTKPEILTVRDKRLEKKIKYLRAPKVLLTGHHRRIAEWRTHEAIKRTKKRRPDLLS